MRGKRMKWQADENRLRECSCVSTFLCSYLRPRLLLAALVAVFVGTNASSLDAQRVALSTAQKLQADRPALTRIRALGSETLKHLREDDLSQALKTLGDATDLSASTWTKDETALAAPAAGVHRKLMQLDAEERFDLLRAWSLPTESRRTVRALTSMVPPDAPPKAFARAIGERPRDNSFPISEVNGVDGLCSTAWLLVKSAEEAGRLRRLIFELYKLADVAVPQAAYVLILARIVDADKPDELLTESVADWRAVLSREQAPELTGKGPVPQHLIWQLGYRGVDTDRRLREFKPFPFFDGFRWKGSAETPDPQFGWTFIQAHGGHTGPQFSPVRRWVAPADGVLSITGDFKHLSDRGDGIRAWILSSRFGAHGEWAVLGTSTSTPVDSIEVRAWDTIDFVADRNRDSGYDDFQWLVQLTLTKPDGGVLKFDSSTYRPEPAIADVPADVTFAAACLEHKWLQPIGESTIEKLVQNAAQPERRFVPAASPLIHSLLQKAQAVAIARRHSAADFRHKSAQPRHWVVGGSDPLLHARGGGRPAWLTHDGHILPLSGAGSSALLFRYPLTGEFEFSCEAQLSGTSPTDAGVAYGGLQFFADASKKVLTVYDDDGRLVGTKPCPFVRGGKSAAFNQFAIRSTVEGAMLVVNGHPMWRLDALEAVPSPWIGLRAFGDRRPLFRNLQITGKPIIPREVRMSGGDSLRGWVQNKGGQEQERPRGPGEGLLGRFAPAPAPAVRPATAGEWSSKDGIIHEPRVGQAIAVRQSHLSYQRPLQNGESISYAFFYEPGKSEVHPAVGRLAFLIEPDGVRLHWITADTNEWTGLSADNAIVEPLHRRGPKPLPLQGGQWNRVNISLRNDVATLSLNDQVIYERPVEPDSGRRFGLLHFRRRGLARVRNVVMTGDWPEALPAEVTSDLAAPHRTDGPNLEFLNDIFGEEDLAANVPAVLRHANSLSDEARFRFLSDWVLPSRDRPLFRLSGAFTTTRPPPTGDASREDTDGQLVSPAYDLVDVAARLDRLAELRDRVAAFESGDVTQQRARCALLFLVEAARRDYRAAEAACEQLLARRETSIVIQCQSLWPETLVSVRGQGDPQTRAIVSELTGRLLEPLLRGESSNFNVWDQKIVSLRGRQSLERSVGNAEPESAMANWIPASRETALTRGLGQPRARWQRRGDQVVKLAPHDTDFLYYRLPLTGEFDVECNTSPYAKRYAGLMFGGVFHALHHSESCYEGTLRSSKSIPLAPPISHEYKPLRMRIRVRDRTCSTFINGRQVSSRDLPKHCEPWLAIYSDARHLSGVRDVRITGRPIVPDRIELAADEELLGWVSYFGEQVGPADGRAAWQYRAYPAGSGVLGVREEAIAGSFKESLLQYHRPIGDDGEIEYKFFYVPGQVLVHPALDRLAFLLDRDGVKIHWVTDGAYAPPGSDPANQTIEPEHRRGPEALPLRRNDWNQIKLVTRGDFVELTLNGELIYARPLEASNRRTFGLFHYADQTEVRAGNLVLRGNWPKSVPAAAEQELATKTVPSLDETRAKLPAEFSHSFVKDGLPAKYFKQRESSSGELALRADGLFTSVRSRGVGTSRPIFPRFTLHGDFDIELEFEQLELSSDNYAALLLKTEHDDDLRPFYRVMRMQQQQTYERVHASVSLLRPGTDRTYDSFNFESCESTSGRLRLARRGNTIYYLFAEGDSTMFRIIGEQAGSAAKTVLDGIVFMPVCDGNSDIQVVWKNISIRAAKMMHLPLSNGIREEKRE